MRDRNRIKSTEYRVGFGDKEHFKKAFTLGMAFVEQSIIILEKKRIKQLCMKRSLSKQVVQHSQTLLKSWGANCDVKLLLCWSDPNCPDIGKIEDVCKYVVAYTGKQNHTTQAEKDGIQNMINW